MGNKKFFAKQLAMRSAIILSAERYANDLAGRVFLYVYKNNWIEVAFPSSRFLHLTGVDTNLSAIDFYQKAKSSELTADQFYFNSDHPYRIAKEKLKCLPNLSDLASKDTCILIDVKTKTVSYSFALTDLAFTVGLVEFTNRKGEVIAGMYVPRTLRTNDDSVERSTDGETVDFILERDASKIIYEKAVFCENGKYLPEALRGIVGSDLEYLFEAESVGDESTSEAE